MAAGRNGPFQGHGASQDHRVFAQIKPICVQLLALSRPGPSSTSPQVSEHLAALRQALEPASELQPLPSPGISISIPAPPPSRLLGASLLNYAFFPISQLFQSQPKGPADLPQRTLQEAFGCLEVLCRHWWARWQAIGVQPSSSTTLPKGAEEALDMWRQLLVLGAIMLSGPPPQQSKGATAAAQPAAASKMSAETSLAVLRFLRSLLAPRQAAATAQTNGHDRPSQRPGEWEWDGESDLPSLDDEPEELSHPALPSTPASLYPTAGHLALVSTTPIKSPLLHALTASLDVLSAASSHSSSIPLRATAIEVARIIAVGWIGATPSSDPNNPAAAVKAKADQLAPLLPGLVSKAVRLLTTSDDGKRISTTSVPGELVARAMTLLGDVVVPVLDDGATKASRKLDAGQSAESGEQKETGAKVQSLEDLLADLQTSDADRNDEHNAPSSRPPPANGSSSSNPQLAALKATLMNLTLAFRSLTASATPRSEAKDEVQDLAAHHHPAAQVAIVSFVADVLEHCGSTLAWFGAAQQGHPGSESLASILFSWILDLAPTCCPGAALSSAEQAAQERLDVLLTHASHHSYAQRCLAAQAGVALKALPPAILAHRNALATRLAHRVSAVAAAALRCNSLAEQLVSEPEMVQMWAERLVECLTLGGSVGGSSVADDGGDGDETVATPPLAHLEPAAGRAVAEMLSAWGQVCGRALLGRLEASAGRRKDGSSSSASTSEGSLSLIYWLSDHSRRQRNLARAHAARGDAASALSAFSQSTAALFILRQVLAGVTEQLNDDRMSLLTGKVGKRARKAAHKLAGDLIKEIEEDWNEEAQQGLGMPDRDGETQEGQANAAASPERQVLNGGDAATSSGAASHFRGLPSSPTPEALAVKPQRFGPALNLSFVSAATVGDGSSSNTLSTASLRVHLSHQQQHLRSLQLSLLSLCSQLLGPAFQSKLLTTIYPLVSALTHPSPLVAHASRRALGGIARATGYADLLSLVRENVDYILGEASWRLVVGLGRELEAEVAAQQQGALPALNGASSALSLANASTSLTLSSPNRPLLSSRTPPLVLTEVMRLLGPSSLHLIEDSVDEILDALDRFHAFDDVADALLRVLDRLLEVMKEEAEANAGHVGGKGGSKWAKKHSSTADPVKDLEALEVWLHTRRKARSPAAGTSKQRDVQEELASAFDKVEQNQHGEGDGDGDGDPSSTDPPTPASRSQQLLVAILSKGLPFLSHSSPLVRARVLRLFTAGTQLLAPVSSSGSGSGRWSRREDLLLPLVNRVWPLVLARLGWEASRPLPTTSAKASTAAPTSEIEPVVHLAALSLLEALARCVPDFIGKRWVDEAWPRVRLLLGAAQAREREAKGQKRGEGKTTRFTSPSADKLVTHEAAATGDGSLIPAPTFRPLPAHSPLATLLSSTLTALTPLLTNLGPSTPDHALWEMCTHPLIVSSLDARQNRELREKAVRFMRAAKAGDEGGTAWCVLALEMKRGEKGRDGQAGAELDVALSAAEIFAP